MKLRLLVGFLLLTLSLQAQNTITSTTNGNATNPLIWDCICFPTPDDEIIINHDVVMNTDWIVSAGGSITVNAAGSFIEDSNHRSILVDGSGAELNNLGTTELTNIALTNGAMAHNHSNMSLDTGLYIDGNSTFMNHGNLFDLDSIGSLGTFTNDGTLQAGDILNTGTWNNSGSIVSDTVASTGTFNVTGGIISANDFGNSGAMDISGGALDINGDFWNAGMITMAMNTAIETGDDFLNGDTIAGSASIINNGWIVVGNDFLNGDDLDGSGTICIANASTNSGSVDGTLDICDNTGVGFFDLNVGTIGPSVTDCVSGCSVGIDENVSLEVQLFPNPALDYVQLPESTVSITVYDVTGAVVLQERPQGNQMNVAALKAGVYLFQIQNAAGELSTSRVIKR